MGTFSPSPIYLLNHVFIIVWIHRYFLYILNYVITFILLHFWIFGHWVVFQFGPISLWHTLISIRVFFFKHFFLYYSTAKCPSLILHISCLIPKTSHFPKDPYFLSWKKVLETKIPTVGILIVTGMPLFRPFQLTKQENIHMYINSDIYTYLN